MITALVATGCGRSPDRDAEPSGRVTPWSSEESTAVREVLAALNGFTEALRIANESGTETPSKELSPFLADPLLGEVVAMIHRNRLKGVFYAGTSVPVDPKVTELRLDAQPPTASVQACTDNSNYRLVYRSGNSPLPLPSGSRRTLGSYSAVYVPGQGWRINNSTNLSTPC